MRHSANGWILAQIAVSCRFSGGRGRKLWWAGPVANSPASCSAPRKT